MLILGYLLALLIPVIAIWYIIWDHKRKTAERDAASAGRLQELLSVTAQPQRTEGVVAAEATQRVDRPAAAPEAVQHTERAAPVPEAALRSERATPPAEATAPPAALHVETPPSAPLYSTRDRVLTPPQTLLYYLLRTGLPDYIVFARVTLASILEAGPGLSGVAREEQTRRLAALTVDFVVSDKNMKPIVVVELAALEQGGAAQADRASARTRLATAGVRYLELDAKKLPRKDAIRAVVLGDAPSGEGGSAALAEAAK